MSSSYCWCVIGKIALVWLCFGISQGLTCGKFQYKNNEGQCSSCRKCPNNIDKALQEGTIVDDCMDTAKPTPEWLQGNYFCQGRYDPLPECKKWSVENGGPSCSNDMQIESNCRLDCFKDYYPSSNESIRCTGDLKWSKPIPYCLHINDSITTAPPPACLEWLPLNGNVTCTQNKDVGSVCTLSCNHGFNPSSNQDVTCSKQLQWEGASDRQLPSCIPEPTTTTPRPSCESFEVVHGTLYCSAEDTYSGSECSVICDEGFTLSVNETVTSLTNMTVICTDNLTWSDAVPTCVEIQKTTTPTPSCIDIEEEYGLLSSCTSEFNVGSHCNVTCTRELESTILDEPLYCRRNQTWSLPSPYCVSPVPVDKSTKETDESFPWYIVGIVVVIIVVVIIVVILGIRCYLKRRENRGESSDFKKRKGSDLIELESISTNEDSGSVACGKCCSSPLIKKEKKEGTVEPIGNKDGSYQPMDGAGSNRPMDGAGSNRPMDGARSNRPMDGAGSNRPMDGAGSLSNQPINRYAVVVCPNTGRPISEESASAEALKEAYNKLENVEKLEKLFDQYPKSEYLTWKHLAAKVLNLRTDEIEHIEYRHKENRSTGPTKVIFGRMIEKGITLFEVIECLQCKTHHDNVVKALDIFYKYCFQQDGAQA